MIFTELRCSDLAGKRRGFPIFPSPLYSYTSGQRDFQVEGASIAALLADLDRQYPGIRFRIVDEQGAVRPHLRFFVNRELVRSLDQPLDPRMKCCWLQP